MKTLQKNNVLIVILFAIAVFMSVGFAVLSTTLNINGQAKVKASSWDIHFENINITNGSVDATKEAIIANESLTFVEYEVELSKPGDFYEFTVDAVNDGTIDALVNLVTLTGIDSKYVNYQVTYLNGQNIKIGDALNAGQKETYKVRIEYIKDIGEVPSEDISLTLTFAITYIQGSGGEIITPYYTLTGTVYDADGEPMTSGEVEVHSKVIKAPINSDGTYILKNVPVGDHEIIIKDLNGSIIREDAFTLYSGDEISAINNKIVGSSDNSIEINIYVKDEIVELSTENPPEVSDEELTPSVNQRYLYPVLNENGINSTGKNSITIDYYVTSIEKLYSLDEGVTWHEYNGEEINLEFNEYLYAKGIDRKGRETPLLVYQHQTPTDALGTNAYDGDETTYVSSPGTTNGYSGTLAKIDKKIYVDSTMQGESIYLIGEIPSGNKASAITIQFYGANDEDLGSIKYSTSETKITIPDGTEVIVFTLQDGGQYTQGYTAKIYEVKINTEPVIENEFVYPILTESGIIPGYNDVTLDYFNNSIQRLYSLDNGSTWVEYGTETIKMAVDEEILVKGIDKNGKETNIISYSSSTPSDSISKNAYDDDATTYDSSPGTSTGYSGTLAKIDKKIYVDRTMYGKTININGEIPSGNKASAITIQFYGANNEDLGSVKYKTTAKTALIPENTELIVFTLQDGGQYAKGYTAKIYEIDVING